ALVFQNGSAHPAPANATLTPWFAIEASRSTTDSAPGAPGADTTTHALLLGLDRSIGNQQGLLGLALTFARSDADLARDTGDLSLETLRLTAYAGWRARSDTWLQLQAGAARDEFKTTRSIRHLATTPAEASLNAWQFNLAAEIGQNIRLRSWTLAPLASLHYDTLRLTTFNEDPSNPAALHYPSQTPRSIETQLALRLTREWTTPAAAHLSAAAQLGWSHEYSATANHLAAALADNLPTFTVRGPATSRDAARLRLALSLTTTETLRATLTYEALLGADTRSHALSLLLGKQF
ncbi:MAG: autotransporter outer membrane beta-barrel domain-containing protein, partial [Opitutaceae bacterium]|nr:autotransporter outer membrane beta-barrel domain-containing protein [Opitutaceae bacterium]